MTVCRATGEIAHRSVPDLTGLLGRGDLLVVNDTKVIRGRIRTRKPTGGLVEILLLSPAAGGGEEGRPERGAGAWEVLARPSGRLREGMVFRAGGGLAVTLSRRLGGGRWEARLDAPGSVEEAVEKAGEIPLPPYIRRREGDPAGERDAARYQTVYAACPGSVAAPTAGLHFDEELLAELKGRGIRSASVTLTIGYGTFASIREEEVEAHRIHPESYRVSGEVSAEVAAAKERGGRIVAVGTTSVRTLETCADKDGAVVPGEGVTRLLITPGYRFRVVDAMLTNFHLPRSTLLALVMAFGGVELIRKAYRVAVAERYRFYSYGDAMFLY
jgi:S-adenosylmethionine:tRNA ribosyltransferase-isomerase